MTGEDNLQIMLTAAHLPNLIQYRDIKYVCTRLTLLNYATYLADLMFTHNFCLRLLHRFTSLENHLLTIQ